MISLDPRVTFAVLARAETEAEHLEELGDALRGPHSTALRAAQQPLARRIERLGVGRALAQAERLVAWMESRPEYAALCAGGARRGGRRPLKASVRFPKPEKARWLHARLDTAGVDFELSSPEAWTDALDALASLREGVRPNPGHPAVRDLLAELASVGWIGEHELAPPRLAGAEPGLLFVGHNTALFSTATTRVLVDPWLRPWHDGDPRDYHPLLPEHLGRVDAICITHGHGDHFHLGTLVRFRRDTRVFVPRVPKDTLVGVSLARTLTELGFTRVSELSPGERVKIGDVEIDALPFYGEQPTATELVDPELRNVGVTYALRTPAFSAAFLADTGLDATGDMRAAALAARRERGPVDAVFTGARGFSLYPLMLPLTTLDVLFANVPLELVAAHQRLMHDSEGALDVAEAFGARFVVPYADGGAPWYWREGMGPSYAGYPSYEGWRAAPSESREVAEADPFPERVAELAARRHSAVSALILRPGDALRLTRGRPRITRFTGYAWPF